MLHTFRAARIEDALGEIKRQLGPNALIVSQRQGARSATLGTPQQSWVEIDAAVFEDAPVEGSSGATTLLARRLLREEVPQAAAAAIASSVSARTRGVAPELSELPYVLASVLGDELTFSPGQRARSVALVGPTGAGKTTTIAKIAAHEQLVRRRSVGLVTLDQYRIGGVEQLMRYAELIGCPMEIASDRPTLAAALRRLDHCELVLIDTAGRTLRDAGAHEALAHVLAGASEPVEVHLCLPVAMRDRDLRMSIERYAGLQPTRLICTKVDETLSRGLIVAAHIYSGLPLSYFTTGQRVPEDLVPASASALAELLCHGEAC